MSATLPRAVHPAAWWGWAVGMAIAVSTTNNPLLLLLALAVVALVVANRRGSSPWARAFRLYLWLGLVIIVVRVVLHVVVGLKFGEIVLFHLPEVTLPSWAAGIQLGGTVYLEGLIGAAVLGLRLAVIIACVGAANALANPKRLLRALPSALHEIGSAVVVSVSVAPQLAESVQRVRRARQLRGDTSRGIRAVPSVALPVLEDTLERSLLLAAAMDSRGYGRAGAAPRSHRLVTGTVTLAGLLASAVGIYGVLDTTTPAADGHADPAAGAAPVGPGALARWPARGAQHLPARPVARGRVADPRMRCGRRRRARHPLAHLPRGAGDAADAVWRSPRCPWPRSSGCSSARCRPTSPHRPRGRPRGCRSAGPARRCSAHG